MSNEIRLYTTDTIGAQPIELGEMVLVTHVQATDLFRDLRERWTNLTGGEMTRYAKLLEDALGEARKAFKRRLAAQGYDGAVAVRIAHPSITEGGAEIVMYGTGFKLNK